jgi:hypothetical protein
VTSVHRDDGTAHAEGRAIDIAFRDAHWGPYSGCPMLYSREDLMSALRAAGPALKKQFPSLSDVIVEVDHIHFEFDRHPGLKIGTFITPTNSPLCRVNSPESLELQSLQGDPSLPKFEESRSSMKWRLSPSALVESGDPRLAQFAQQRLAAEVYDPRLARVEHQVARPIVGPTNIAAVDASISEGIPFITLPRDVKVDIPPIPLATRAPVRTIREMMIRSGANSPQPPIVVSTNAPAFDLTAEAEAESELDVPFFLLDFGPQALNTPAGGQITINIEGVYKSGPRPPVTLDTLVIRVPRVDREFRVAFIPWRIVSGIPQPTLFNLNNARTPNGLAVGAGNPTAAQGLRVFGTVPAGVQTTLQIPTPSHPMWGQMLESLS